MPPLALGNRCLNPKGIKRHCPKFPLTVGIGDYILNLLIDGIQR
jgi:hypothetical protein